MTALLRHYIRDLVYGANDGIYHNLRGCRRSDPRRVVADGDYEGEVADDEHRDRGDADSPARCAE